MSFPSHQKPISLNTLGDTSDVNVLEMLRFATLTISSMKHFGSVGIAALRSPLYEGVFDSTVINDLRTLYSALYPDRVIHRVSPFYEYSGRATLCTQYQVVPPLLLQHFGQGTVVICLLSTIQEKELE